MKNTELKNNERAFKAHTVQLKILEISLMSLLTSLEECTHDPKDQKPYIKLYSKYKGWDRTAVKTILKIDDISEESVYNKWQTIPSFYPLKTEEFKERTKNIEHLRNILNKKRKILNEMNVHLRREFLGFSNNTKRLLTKNGSSGIFSYQGNEIELDQSTMPYFLLDILYIKANTLVDFQDIDTHFSKQKGVRTIRNQKDIQKRIHNAVKDFFHRARMNNKNLSFLKNEKPQKLIENVRGQGYKLNN